eukprot:CAMPEP_0118863492 /NCGR_PEP_ID=MMETSP1163-20130328/8344_1 /TAXON_ID=124430 /ORGANISM="Phaeomonas parva, Strain CCMP2877" /LENGTH=287 /DNA_ID=CAMNT_0006797501 /DNA_START=72 /DNA_END=935 /DNA_ORIENTATION=-
MWPFFSRNVGRGVTAVSREVLHQMSVGTLNVHGFLNGRGEESFDAVVALLRRADLDVIALQECPRKDADRLANELGDEWGAVAYAGNAIISRLAIQPLVDERRPPPVRSVMAIIISPGGRPVEVVCVHLDHRREDLRIRELRGLVAFLNNSGSAQLCQRNMLWLGDFNALTRGDYGKAAANSVAEVRVTNGWEPPRFEATTVITSNKRRAQNIGRGKQIPGLGFVDCRSVAARRTGSIGTCRFDTRIDYAFMSKALADSCEVLSSKHIKAMPAVSDHHLVTANLMLQ